MVPARNEEKELPGALDALARSVDHHGRPLPPSLFEAVLLLNNCTDGSAEAARHWQVRNPSTRLHIVERDFPEDRAHIGTARRSLMDTAWHRLRGRRGAAILSTDADTRVAPDWIAANLRAIQHGADAVGGAICFESGELETMAPDTRRAWEWDTYYQHLVAELEHWLDPRPGDPWPRHRCHFGGSMACTPEVYARAGGLPPERSLEDVAFVRQLWRVDACLRHAPEVRVYSSARLEGRVSRGLSSQLREWRQWSENGRPHRVHSCAWLVHYFSMLQGLRELWRGSENLPPCFAPHVGAALAAGLGEGEFLAQIHYEKLIRDSFRGRLWEPIESVCRDLMNTLVSLRRQSECLELAGD